MTPIISEGSGASYTFKGLVEEVAARGFTDMLDGGARESRLKRWVNQAYRELVDIAPWPFLQDQIEGTMPLEIEDLGHVLSVSDPSQDRMLDPIDERQVSERDPARDDTGTARYWFRVGMTTLEVHPAAASTFVVRYVKQPAALIEDGDEPVVPPAYCDLVVDGATVHAYKNRDNFEAAQFLRQEWERGVKGMQHALLKPNYDKERSIVRTGDPRDYL